MFASLCVEGLHHNDRVVNRADSIVADTLGKEFKTASYYSSASSRTAMLYINITAYDERDVTAPQLQEKLADKFENFQGARVNYGRLGDLSLFTACTGKFTVHKEAVDVTG